MSDENEKETETEKSEEGGGTVVETTEMPVQPCSTFRKNIVINYEGGGQIHLRRPTTKELNKFDSISQPRGRKGLQVDKLDGEGARIWLFDTLFVKIINFQDETGDPIAVDDKDSIPVDDKAYIILHSIQSKENIDVKN